MSFLKFPFPFYLSHLCGILISFRDLGSQSPHVRQIDLDIRRTFRRHVMFRERYSPSQVDLFSVLTAHSVYNKQVNKIILARS